MVDYITSQLAKRSREERALINGVTFTYSDTANGRCYYTKFKSGDRHKLSGRIMPGLVDEKLYFLPATEKDGFYLKPENKAKNVSVLTIRSKNLDPEVANELDEFCGEYDSLEYNQPEHMFYIDRTKKKQVSNNRVERAAWNEIPELIEEANEGTLTDDEMISLGKLLAQWTKGILTKEAFGKEEIK